MQGVLQISPKDPLPYSSVFKQSVISFLSPFDLEEKPALSTAEDLTLLWAKTIMQLEKPHVYLYLCGSFNENQRSSQLPVILQNDGKDTFLYAKLGSQKCTSELYFIVYWIKEHNVIFFFLHFSFYKMPLFPFHIPKNVNSSFISLYAQSMYI